MTCTHLQQLYQLCQQNDLKLSSSDLIHVVCKQCDKEEVCPSTLAEEYDEKRAVAEGEPPKTR
ncbi:unnamed protein product [marine sediment metagenome]|uniref:Uncharacterized protein n=1 Tax=marine sediment metagenome TaxID=412755 RepID=X1A6A0_9ZZZZ